MSTLKNIKDGWGNYVKSQSPEGLPEEIQRLAEGRASICAACPELKESELFRWVDRIINNNGTRWIQNIYKLKKNQEARPGMEIFSTY